MNLSSEMLNYLRFLGIQIGQHPDHYAPQENTRALVYTALEQYRVKYIEPERKEEFYTIAMAAFQDGEEEGRRLFTRAQQLVEANRAAARQ